MKKREVQRGILEIETINQAPTSLMAAIMCGGVEPNLLTKTDTHCRPVTQTGI